LPLEQALPTERHIFFLPRYFTISSVSNGNIIFTIWTAFVIGLNPINFVLGIFLTISQII
jgi:hypothetical protein